MRESSATAVFVLGLATLASWAVAQDARPALRLTWYDPSGLAQEIEFDARAEAANVLERMGVAVSWRRAAAGEIMRGDEVWVVLVGAGPKGARAGEVLGATCTSPTTSRLAWVRVPHVAAAVGAGGASIAGLPQAERKRVARATGRVIAHEVVHVLVPTLPHGAGLMAEALTRRQLTETPVLIAPGTARFVRLAVARRPLPAPQRTVVLYALAAKRASR